MTVYKGSVAQSELSQGSNAFAEAYKGGNKVFSKSDGIPEFTGQITGDFGQRLANICTVIQLRVDSNLNGFIEAVLDSNYRTYATFGSYPSFANDDPQQSNSKYARDYSPTETCNTLITRAGSRLETTYPALYHCQSVAKIKINGIIYKGLLPQCHNQTAIIYSKMDYLDSIDTSISNLKFSDFKNQSYSWFCTCSKYSGGSIESISYDGTVATCNTSDVFYVCPIFEIPVNIERVKDYIYWVGISGSYTCFIYMNIYNQNILKQYISGKTLKKSCTSLTDRYASDFNVNIIDENGNILDRPYSTTAGKRMPEIQEVIESNINSLILKMNGNDIVFTKDSEYDSYSYRVLGTF